MSRFKREPAKKNYWDMLLKEVINQNKSLSTYYFIPMKNNKTIKNHDEKCEQGAVIYKKMVNKRYYLGEVFDNAYLTAREAETVNAVLHSKTLAGAASQLQLSPRTVEYYFENVKKKLCCQKKKEVVEKFKNSELLKIINKI